MSGRKSVSPAKRGSWLRRRFRPRRILVIEDDPLIAALIRTLLERAGYRVELAGDGFHAVKQAQAHPPDLILCDLALPEFGGLEVARYLQQDARTCDVPRIAMSAHTREGILEEVRAAGFHDYLPKPFAKEELLALIRTWLS